MSASSSPPSDARQAPPRRLKLVMNTSPQSQTNSIDPAIKEESSSPVRPSYSPVTPTLSHAPLVREDASHPQWMDEPEPLPVSLDDNPDAIALRATISLLQMQRQQSLRDIRNLDRMKYEALRDPHAFVKDLRDGKLQTPATGDMLFDDEDSSEHDDNDDERRANTNEDQPISEQGSKFGKLPTAQNIARCPPIEWSKYHIVGESLDRLHALQQEYPGLTEEALARGLQPRPHQITSPYNPFTDKIEIKRSLSQERNYDK